MCAQYTIKRTLLVTLGCGCTLYVAAGCQSGAQNENETEPQVGEKQGRTSTETEAKPAAPFGEEADVQRAQSLWDEMEGYLEWETYPGKDGWQEGTSAHGKVLRYYVNAVVAEDPQAPRDGAILVKENYSAEEEDAIVSVTVMKKIAGYDPDNANRFWVKFSPEGDVVDNKQGTPLAGRVAKGSNKGCIACHAEAGGGDYVFAND